MSAYSKAIVALIMAVIGVLNVVFGMDIEVSPEFITALVVHVLTPALVYLVPNKGN